VVGLAGPIGRTSRPRCILYMKCTQVHNIYTVYIYIYIDTDNILTVE
jgi:hypothetical protein